MSWTRATITAVALLAGCLPARLAAADFSLGFECPGAIAGRPGETVTFEAYATLTTANNPGPYGVQGSWRITVAANGAEVLEISVDGVHVSTIYDDDGDPATPYADPYDFDLGDAVYHDTIPMMDCWGDPKGIFLAVVLSQLRFAALQPNGAQRIARIIIQAKIPETGCIPVTLRYMDEAHFPADQPGACWDDIVLNNVTFIVNQAPYAFLPSRVPNTIQLCSMESIPFTLGFEGGPDTISGDPGEVKTFDVFATLASAEGPGAPGASGWQIALAAEGAEIVGISGDGLHVSAVYDDDGNPSTPPIDPYDLDLKDAAASDAAIVPNPDDPALKSGVSTVVLGSAKSMTLQPAGTQRIARITLRRQISIDDGCFPVTLRYLDSSWVSAAGSSIFATLGPPRAIQACSGETAGCPVAFEAPASLPVARQPVTPVAADLDGDGKPDLVTASNSGDNAVSILWNLGGRAFTAAASVPAGNTPYGVAAADLDGDGDLDLAVANKSPGITVLRNDGSRNFVPAKSLSVPGGAFSLVPADFDGDGKVDLAAVGLATDANNNSLYVLQNRGSLTFGAAKNYRVAPYPNGIAAGDLNGDGRPDIVTANNSDPDDVSVLLNKGDGTFLAAVGIPTGHPAFHVILADLDGDGDLDIAGTDMGTVPFTSNAWVLRNKGDGTFDPAERITLAMDVETLVAADLNGDEAPDLALAGAGSYLWTLCNKGGGTFAVPSGLDTGAGHDGVAAADFDGDGKIDLAASDYVSGNVTVFWNGTGVQRGGLVLPGDANGDGTLDISDAVATLGFLFLGSPAGLPCGDGSATDPANVKLVDWQPDGTIDLSDGVAMLTFLFLGGDPHALAVPGAESTGCVRIVGCQDRCGK